MALTPPYTSPIPGLFIPDYPYARGGHHLSNGSTWIEQLATRMKLGNSVGPALRVPGKFSNYAIDRTRACPNSLLPSHIDLSTQVANIVAQFGPVLPSDALYVVFVGSNDVRDALVAQDFSFIGCALASVDFNIRALANAGAKTFLVANVPNLGLIPALDGAEAAGTFASLTFNELGIFDPNSGTLQPGLADILDAIAAEFRDDGVRIHTLDTFGLITELVENPPTNLNVSDSCIDTVTNTVCAPAKNNLFWDSIHPTKTGHAFLAEAAEEALAQEPL